MALIHREDPGFGPLAESQARARDLHGALTSSTPRGLEHETVMISGKLRPFAELLALVDGWNTLDDDPLAPFLQDAITEAFGRPLALAGHAGQARVARASCHRPSRARAAAPPRRIHIPRPIT